MQRASHPPWPNFANSFNNEKAVLKYTQTEHRIPKALGGGGGAVPRRHYEPGQQQTALALLTALFGSDGLGMLNVYGRTEMYTGFW